MYLCITVTKIYRVWISSSSNHPSQERRTTVPSMPGVRTGKANMKVVTGFTIKQLEWEKYRSLQYTSSALMSSIGIKYGQFAQVLARIKAAFEADGFNPKESKNIIESVKHDVLNGMMQIVEVKPKDRMLFDKIYNFIIYWFTILYSVYKRIVLQFSTILISLFYFCNKETEIKLIFHQIYDDFAKTFPIMGYDIRGKCKIRN